ncbi:Shedu anti-phage system protein SduA domain-containing protein [Streptomyces sp. NPDC002018]|uniref:Shedu anti-phage system protein SduA domain-containing protein n=1 Tax=Streptomyces sp. NPDC002018 TaxID=3364629 RepID=UPI0036C6B3A0
MTLDPDAWPGWDGLGKLRALLRKQVNENPTEALANAKHLLINRASAAPDKSLVPRIAAEAALHCGLPGIELLREIALSHRSPLLGATALESLWAVSIGQPVPFMYFGGEWVSTFPELRESAGTVLDDLIIDSHNDDELFGALLSLANRESPHGLGELIHPEGAGFARHFMQVSAESGIILTARMLDNFRDLISSSGLESVYQDFLERNPVLLNPLAAEVISQGRLGLEFITDFVVRLHDGRYVVIEIERPQDPIFTKAGDLSARFNHAVGQILDFQSWIAENTAYAQKIFPGISSPHGLLIMRLRPSMTGKQESKLRRWQQNSRDIQHVTFDDLHRLGLTLLRSLRGKSDTQGQEMGS